MWNYQSGQWTTESAGDFLMRLKVIPLVPPGVEENTNKPFSVFNLAQIAPNPVRTAGIIEYQLPVAQRVSLSVYDVTGQLVRTLVNETRNAGTHQAIWDGRDSRGTKVSSGVYLYRLQGESESVTKKMILVH
ncbi:T9SS type A sorting domain-containing protein [candidate division WOR-3 bacterium]|nr:T9SS type A sorting domain-containing protein [candidate division WOR-3 bacterium]